MRIENHPLAKENANAKIFYKNPEESCQEFDTPK
jgi:hypothetical protein